MRIAGLQKLTLLDYPDHMACIVFTQGCNFNCGYCQNSSLIDFIGEGTIEEDEIFEFLKKRKGILSGVVITGGEPTVQNDLKDFIKKIKELGYEVKLDTNGTNPKIIKELIDENLVDYIAMDIKHVLSNYKDVTKVNADIKKLEESIGEVKRIPHEFRTTVIKGIHDIDSLSQIIDHIGEYERYYLQNFVMSDLVRDKSLLGFTKEELENIKNTLNKKYPNVDVRM